MATITNFLTDLSYLLGEDSVPTSGVDYRIGFINNIVDDIASRKKWSWLEAKATISLTNRVGDMPDDYRSGGIITVKDSDNRFYSETREEYASAANSRSFYITGNEVDGFEIGITNDDYSEVEVVYTKEAPVFTSINDTSNFPIPLRMAVAKGALIDVRRYENPFYDVSPETIEYENEIRKLLRIERQTKKPYQQISARGWNNGTTL